MQYLEDIAAGQSRTFGTYEVTRDEVIEFATKYDPQPFHLSDDAAAQTFFGRIAASGWHTCAMTMRMLVDDFTEHGLASLGSPGIDELRWKTPVYPGDTLRVESNVLDVRPSVSNTGMGIIRSQLRVFNQHDVEVLSMITNAMVRTRPDAG